MLSPESVCWGLHIMKLDPDVLVCSSPLFATILFHPVYWEVNTTGSWGDLCLNLPRLETENVASAIQTILMSQAWILATICVRIFFLSKNTPKKYCADNFLDRKLPLEKLKQIHPNLRRLPFLPNAKQAMAAFLEAHCTQRMCSCVYWALHNGWKKTKTRLSQLTILVTEKLTSPVRTGLLHSPVSPRWRRTASHCTLSTGGHCVENVQIRVEWKSSVSCLRLQCHGCTARSSEHRRNHRRCTNSNTEPQFPQLHTWQCKIWQLYIIANGTQLTSHLVVKTFKNTKAHCIKC